MWKIFIISQNHQKKYKNLRSEVFSFVLAPVISGSTNNFKYPTVKWHCNGPCSQNDVSMSSLALMYLVSISKIMFVVVFILLYCLYSLYQKQSKIKCFSISDPMAFSCLRVQHNLLGDITTRAQNLVEILHGIKRFYQVSPIYCCVLIQRNIFRNMLIFHFLFRK